MRRLAPVVALLALSLGRAAIGHAEPKPYAMVPVLASEAQLESQAADLTESLVDAFEASGIRIEVAEVRLDEIKTMLACDEEIACLRQLATTMAMAGVVTGKLTPGDGGVPRLDLMWVTADDVYKDQFSVPPDDRSWMFDDQARAFAHRRPYADPNKSSGKSGSEPEEWESPRERSRVRAGSWLMLAGGAVGVAVSALFLDAAAKRQRLIDDAPTDTAAQLEALRENEEAARRYNVAGTSILLVGGAAVVYGAIRVVSDLRAPKDETKANKTTVTIGMPSAGGGLVVGIGGVL